MIAKVEQKLGVHAHTMRMTMLLQLQTVSLPQMGPSMKCALQSVQSADALSDESQLQLSFWQILTIDGLIKTQKYLSQQRLGLR